MSEGIAGRWLLRPCPGVAHWRARRGRRVRGRSRGGRGADNPIGGDARPRPGPCGGRGRRAIGSSSRITPNLGGRIVAAGDPSRVAPASRCRRWRCPSSRLALRPRLSRRVRGNRPEADDARAWHIHVHARLRPASRRLEAPLADLADAPVGQRGRALRCGAEPAAWSSRRTVRVELRDRPRRGVPRVRRRRPGLRSAPLAAHQKPRSSLPSPCGSRRSQGGGAQRLPSSPPSARARHLSSVTTQVPSGRPSAGPGTMRAELTRSSASGAATQ